MALSIANSSDGAPAPSGSTFVCPITRSAGESLVFAFHWEYEWGAVPSITSVIWDPAGDNQTLTLLEQQDANANRKFAVYHLKNPTSIKTGDIVVTLANASLSFAAYICDRIIDASQTTWITSSAKRTETTPVSNGLPNTVASAADELVIFYGHIRDQLAYVNAGDLSNYVERTSSQASRSVMRGTKPGAASVTGTFGFTDVTNYDNALIALSIAPAAGGGGTATITHAATLDPVTQTQIASTLPALDLTHSVTLDPVTQTLNAAVTPGLGLTHAATLGEVTQSFTLDFAPFIVSPPLSRNNGSVAASMALDWVTILNGSTGAFVATKTGLSTNGAGVFAVSDAGMTPGSTYQLTWKEAGGARGMGWGVAA